MRLRLPAALATFVALTALAHAQAPNPGAPDAAPATTHSAPNAGNNAASHSGISRADRNFSAKAAAAGAAEIADAQIALKNSDRQDVKDFAQRMVDDHTKAADQLKSIASSAGINLPSGESAADQKATDALQKLSGAQLDRHYIEGQRKAHRQAVALFAKESKSGQDSQLKSFAGQTLPTLQDHLKMISAMPLGQQQQTSSAPR